MAKTENKGRCKSFDNQMIDFFCFSYDFGALYRVWVLKRRK